MNKNDSQRSELKPSLDLFDATAINVGAIIGAGIFVVTGIAASYAGSAMIISMIIAAVIAMFTALSFAELTAWQPREGSVYEYAYQLVSPFFGFLVGWMWLLSNMFTGAAVSLGFAYYFTAVFPFLPIKLVATILCIAFAILNYVGIRQSALLNNFLVIAKLLILAFFVIFGVGYVNPENLTPFNPLNAGVLYGAFYLFFAYGGFARVAVVAEEVKDARKNVPCAIILSLLISTLFYIFVGLVALGLVGASGLSSDSNSPLTTAIEKTGNAAAVYIVSVGGLLATASVLLTAILGVSRMTYAMSGRGDMPKILSKLHPKYNTPYISILIVGAFMVFLVLFIPLNEVVAISTFALVFYYTVANVSALRLKSQNRLYPRVFPILGAASCLALLVFIIFAALASWIVGVTSLAIGAVIYLVKEKYG